MTPEIHNLILAGQADLDAASRYRCLADHSPSLARDYRRRADLAEQLGKQKLDDAGQRITALAAIETAPTLEPNNKGGN
jgi:hypothetical protein